MIDSSVVVKYIQEDSDWKYIFNQYCTYPTPVISMIEYTYPSGHTHRRSIDDDYRQGVPIENIEEVIYYQDGENDGPDWLGIFKVQINAGNLGHPYNPPGKVGYLAVRAGCDYTGWDCQASGESFISDTLEGLILFGLTLSERKRLGIPEGVLVKE